MPDDKPSYKQARKADPNVRVIAKGTKVADPNISRVVVEGIDEPKKPFSANVPPDQPTSTDIEDQRHMYEKPLPRLGKL